MHIRELITVANWSNVAEAIAAGLNDRVYNVVISDKGVELTFGDRENGINVVTINAGKTDHIHVSAVWPLGNVPAEKMSRVSDLSTEIQGILGVFGRFVLGGWVAVSGKDDSQIAEAIRQVLEYKGNEEELS